MQQVVSSQALRAGTAPEKPEGRLVAVALSGLDAIREKGSGTIVEIKGETVLLVRDEADAVAAFSPVCPHAKCPVAFDGAAKRIVCDCHGSTFDLAGKFVSGPAKDPLRRFPCTVKGDKLIIKLPDEPVLPAKAPAG